MGREEKEGGEMMNVGKVQSIIGNSLRNSELRETSQVDNLT